MRIQLTRKLADYLDGIDLSNHAEGDTIDLPSRDAALLVAEGWAIPLKESPAEVREFSSAFVPAIAADTSTRVPRTVEQLRRIREQMETQQFEQHERRRAEDSIREERHDELARTIPADQSDSSN
jgi:hypothetical protein